MQLGFDASRSNTFTSVEHIKTQLDLDASRGNKTQSQSRISGCSLSLMQAAGSSTSLFVAYVKTQLDLDAIRGSNTLTLIAYIEIQLQLVFDGSR